MSQRGIAIYAFSIVLFGVFGYFASSYDYFPGDVAISQWLQGADSAWFEPIMRFAPYVVGLGVLVSLRFWRPGKRLAFIFIAAVTSAAGIVSWLLKLVVGRPRPTPELVQVMVDTQGASFPSGHVAMVAVAGGFLFYLMPRLVESRTTVWLLRALLVVIIAAVGFSRVYLGAHWTSDVVGGLFPGGLLLYPTIVLYNKYDAKRRTRDARAA